MSAKGRNNATAVGGDASQTVNKTVKMAEVSPTSGTGVPLVGMACTRARVSYFSGKRIVKSFERSS
jgi:hypothetical protein